MVTVEQLYKDYGVLADAGDKAGEVSRLNKTTVFRSNLFLFVCTVCNSRDNSTLLITRSLVSTSPFG